MAEYLSSFTGAEIDTAVQKALDITSTPENIDVAVAQELATADYVVERGTSNGWSYRKYASGDAECHCVFATGEMTMSADGALYLSAAKTVAFPAGLFIEQPTAVLSVTAAGGLVSAKPTGATTKDNLSYQVFRAGNYGTGTYIAAHVIGRWK